MASSNELSEAGPDDDALYLEQYHPNFLWALALAFPVLPLFWNYHVRVTKEIVSFGYSTNIVAKTVDRSSITSVEPFEINPLSGWGGWGIRLRRAEGSWQTGYVSQGGSGVKLNTNEKGKDSVYVFSCNDPKTVCDLLSPEKKLVPVVEN
jgi:hypothetical protein